MAQKSGATRDRAGIGRLQTTPFEEFQNGSSAKRLARSFS
jgi:hypothetical protein